MHSDNPIINSPYEEPNLHYDTDSEGNIDYRHIVKERRIFKGETQVVPGRQEGQKEVWEWNEDVADYGDHLINLCRKEVKRWREEHYPNTSRVSRDLLHYWFLNPERPAGKRLFFAQREAIETAIWLNEVADKSNAGQHILNLLRAGQQSPGKNPDEQLPRIAFKMATGTGKTVVMACLIAYHYFNRQQYRNDTRFADYFLVVAPGVTIKDRLGVLFVDTKTSNPVEIEDYYRVRALVPPQMEPRLQNLNARLIITNYHNFEPKTLQGNKRSPFDGKVNLKGEKNNTGNKEDYALLIKRLLGKFKTGTRLLVLNDEAHHCYLPKSSGKTEDNEEVNENERAAVWFNGLRELAKRFKLNVIYDLSATPYYLKGSGHAAYSLFPWVVSDFGLIEAIEAGLVKIPFLPESDNTHELGMPVLRNLYEHVKNELPKKGISTAKREASQKGLQLQEEKPQLPALIKTALDQFYNHYREYDQGARAHSEEKKNLLSAPPVFIAVCNNTRVSKEVYKYIAGYVYTLPDGKTQVVPGVKEMFSNFDPHTLQPLKRPPTLLIDSDALENSEQVNEDFKKIFAPEIDEFKKDYARLHGQGSTDKITDAQLLREVVNTVGKPGKLGAHIRAVVSVSMLTEGWDANTVTHIMGLRAFGSQLLCEQVAGRALRRMNYRLKTYRRDTGEEVEEKDRHKFKPEKLIEKFPPEYAHIIGVPFKLFKGGKTEQPPPPVDYTYIKALPERQGEHEIMFPNIIGYRVEGGQDHITWDFSVLENFEIRGDLTPIRTRLANAFSEHEIEIEIQSVLQKREQEIIFWLTRELINHHFTDDDGNRYYQRFNKLRQAVSEWYQSKISLLNISDPQYKKLLWYEDPKTITSHIVRGINPEKNTREFIRPVFNFYNKFSSTRYVNGHTVKEVYSTHKSHINYVVMDSHWEGIAAKTLEEIPEVLSYVKNQFLGLAIPYVKEGKDRLYYPDFVARVQAQDGSIRHLLIEISGMSKDKAEKKWFVENRWLPAVNAFKQKYQYPEWHFVEIANDIRNIQNQLSAAIAALAGNNPLRDLKLLRLQESFGSIQSSARVSPEQLRRENLYDE